MMSDMVVNQQETSSPKPESIDVPILIGVLGTIDNTRRDYETLIRALRDLSICERKRFKLLFLGGPPPQTDISQFRSRISKLVEAEFPDEPGFLLDYIPRGSSCDALLAPLKEEAGYGITKGSGAFGDLLAMRKMLIAPRTSDPMQEFSAFAHYYRGESELAKILKQIIADPFSMLTVNHTDYEQWSAPSVYKRNITLFS
jgi:hypothetical protein